MRHSYARNDKKSVFLHSPTYICSLFRLKRRCCCSVFAIIWLKRSVSTTHQHKPTVWEVDCVSPTTNRSWLAFCRFCSTFQSAVCSRGSVCLISEGNPSLQPFGVSIKVHGILAREGRRHFKPLFPKFGMVEYSSPLQTSGSCPVHLHCGKEGVFQDLRSPFDNCVDPPKVQEPSRMPYFPPPLSPL